MSYLIALVKKFEIDWFLLTAGGLKTSWYSSQNFKKLISLTYTMSVYRTHDAMQIIIIMLDENHVFMEVHIWLIIA